MRDAQYIYKFAFEIKNAPIRKLAEAVMETGNAKYICNFACYMVHQ